MFRPKLPQQEQGFTLVEVLVSILIAGLFVATALQGMVIATLFKARAQQYAEATTWIQEDLESVRQRAALLGSTTTTVLSSPPPSPLNSLPVSSTTGFSANNKVQISTVSNTLYTVTDVTDNTIEVSPALTTALPTGTSVSVATTGSTNTTLCYANSSTGSTSGFGNLLSNNLPTLNSTNNTKKITGTTYTLSRNTTINNDPFEVLQITYSVAENNKPALATLNTEVIPKAALQCPPF